GEPKAQNLPDPQSLNAYSYSQNNPITRSDPNGRCGTVCVVGSAAYVGTITWDLGTDVYQNVKDPSVPWYSVLTPRGDDAALRYNRDAWSGVAVAESALAGEELAAPAVAAKAITVGGQKVIGATVAGVANATNAWMSGAAVDPNTHRVSPQILESNFISGFAG